MERIEVNPEINFMTRKMTQLPSNKHQVFSILRIELVSINDVSLNNIEERYINISFLK